jgi:hypothetical protein
MMMTISLKPTNIIINNNPNLKAMIHLHSLYYWMQSKKWLSIKFTIVTAALSGFQLNTAQTVITSDSVSGSWSAGASPYIITRNVTVPAHARLTIEQGTDIYFTGNYALRIEGKMIARGTRKNTISFAFADSSMLAEYKSVSDSNAADIPGWKGIRFMKNRHEQDTSVLAFCIIQGAKALTGIGDDCKGGAISIQGPGKVMIKNCFIKNNQAQLGAALFCDGNNATLDGNVIQKNQSLSNGGAVCFFNCLPVFKNNLVRANSSPEFGGGLYCYRSGGTFVNNIFVENHARFGGAISLSASSIRFINNTLADNRADINGGGIHCDKSSPFIKNSIVWGNEAKNKGKQLYLYAFGYPDIVYSTLQGGEQDIEKFSDTLNYVTNYEFNLQDDPLFDKEDTAFYCLKENSPCIDAGSNRDQVISDSLDMNGRPRIINRIIDMGAQEFWLADKEDKMDETYKKSDELSDPNPGIVIHIYPNPNNGKFTVEVSNPDGNITSFGIVNANGQTIYLQNISLNESVLKQPVNLDVTRGFYFIELKNSHGNVVKREKIIIE